MSLGYSQGYRDQEMDILDAIHRDEQQSQPPHNTQQVEDSASPTQRDPENATLMSRTSNNSISNETIESIRSSPPKDQTTISTHDIPSPTSPNNKPKVSWHLEISALFLSWAALIIIIILLAIENGKPLSDWKPFFSLNTIISILGVVAHFSIAFAVSSCIGQEKWNWFGRKPDKVVWFGIFDDASRGAAGSLRLAWRLRFRHFATLGALTAIILLAFDPFLQAIITYEGSLDVVDHGTTNTIKAATSLSAGLYQDSPGGSVKATNIQALNNYTVNAATFISQPDMGMSAAVYNGFANLSANKAITANWECLSGNCTWAPYTSLAICSSCNDITSHIDKSRKTGAPRGSTTDEDFSVTYTNYALPGFSIANFDGVVSTSNTDAALYPITLGALAQSSHNDSLTFRDNINVISSIMVMKADEGYADGKIIWQDTPVTATECALYMCTNLYNSFVENGDLVENITDTWSRRDMDSFQATLTPGYSDLNDTVSEAWSAQEAYPFVFPNGDLYREDLELFITPEDIAGNSHPANTTLQFNITQSAISSMVIWIQETFFTDTMIQYGANMSLPGQPPVAQSLAQSPSLNETFDSVALSMTTWIRNNGVGVQEGTMQEWVIHTRIRWGFLAGPCLAVVCGCLFTVLTMANTRRMRLPSWKSDALATMIHGLNDEQRERLRIADEKGELKQEAGQLLVQFGDMEKGSHLETIKRRRDWNWVPAGIKGLHKYNPLKTKP